jgi:tRNA (guanine10-N2)-methyltransferase
VVVAPPRRRAPEGGCVDSPFWRLRVPSHAAAAAIVRRSLLVKVALDIWGEGDTLEEMTAAVLAHPGAHASACDHAPLPSHAPRPAEAARAPYLAPGTSFKVLVDGFGCHHSMAVQADYLRRLESIPFLGRVDLKARHRKRPRACRKAQC